MEILGYQEGSFLWGSLLGTVAFFFFLFCAVFKVLLYEDLVELLLAVLAVDQDHLLVVYVHFFDVSVFFAFFLLHASDGRSEVLGSSLPVVTIFCLVEPFSSGHSHLLLLLQLRLLGGFGLNRAKNTCSLEMTLLASELNSFLLDMKTNLHAFACFSSAFLLNFLPQPSGHIIKSFSLSGGKVSSCSSSWMGFSS